MAANRPVYLTLAASGELEERARDLTGRLRSCSLCPRACGADRTDPRQAFCRIGATQRSWKR